MAGFTLFGSPLKLPDALLEEMNDRDYSCDIRLPCTCLEVLLPSIVRGDAAAVWNFLTTFVNDASHSAAKRAVKTERKRKTLNE